MTKTRQDAQHQHLQAARAFFAEGFSPLRILAVQLMFLLEPFGNERIGRLARRLDNATRQASDGMGGVGEGEAHSQ